MNFSSRILEQAVEEIAQLPGIGKRTALRLALHILRRPKSQTFQLSEALNNLVENLNECQKCGNLCDDTICHICSNPLRKKDLICVVEDVRDLMAIENTGQYRGLYHVLGGRISPIDGVGPEQLNIQSLLNKSDSQNIKEIIFALSSTIEGETTMFYVFKKISNQNIKFSTIARGIGIGEELEYTDEMTLAQSIENRIPYTEN